MSPKTEEVLRQALELPDEARAELAGRLIESLDEAEDEGVEAAWDAEISRRLHELDSGAVKPVSWTEARRMILESGDEPHQP
jgi:putative addiction module component (TIGR02574 family)